MRLISCVVLAALAFTALLQPATAVSQPPAETSAAVVRANNQFAIDLYRQLKKERSGKNLFFSPASVSIALAMTAAGARGETAAEMARVLHLGDLAAAHAEYRRLLDRWNADDKDRGYQLRVANRLWGQKDESFLASFLTLTREQYGAELGLVDFLHRPDAARSTINNWVARQTNDKILDLMPAGSIDASTRLVLTNAIYFKGGWRSPFEKYQTLNEDFTVSAGRKVQAPLMNQKRYFEYAEDESLDALALPYRGDDLSMIVLLPKARDGLAAVEKSLTAEKIAKLRDGLRMEEVVVSLPKFKLDSTFSMNDALSSLGMKLPFSPAADFSGMDGKQDLRLSAVYHKAYVNVDEEGTEAAAATGGAMMAKAARGHEPPPIIFRADHPFIFMICDNQTGNILFLGRVVNPKG